MKWKWRKKINDEILSFVIRHMPMVGCTSNENGLTTLRRMMRSSGRRGSREEKFKRPEKKVIGKLNRKPNSAARTPT